MSSRGLLYVHDVSYHVVIYVDSLLLLACMDEG